MKIKKGMTLIELIVTMGIVVICLCMFSLIFNSNNKIFKNVLGEYDIKNNSKIACENIANIIKYSDEILLDESEIRFLNNDNEKFILYVEGSKISENEDGNVQRRFSYVLKKDDKKSINNLVRYEYVPIEEKIYIKVEESRNITDTEKNIYLKNSNKNSLELNDKYTSKVHGKLKTTSDNNIIYNKHLIFKPYKSKDILAIYYDKNEKLKILKVKEQPLNDYENYNVMKKGSNDAVIARDIEDILIKQNGSKVNIKVYGGGSEKDKNVLIEKTIVLDKVRGAI